MGQLTAATFPWPLHCGLTPADPTCGPPTLAESLQPRHITMFQVHTLGVPVPLALSCPLSPAPHLLLPCTGLFSTGQIPCPLSRVGQLAIWDNLPNTMVGCSAPWPGGGGSPPVGGEATLPCGWVADCSAPVGHVLRW